eukprot:jgi/Tetstr1/425143/TSEL_015605.t1
MANVTLAMRSHIAGSVVNARYRRRALDTGHARHGVAGAEAAFPRPHVAPCARFSRPVAAPPSARSCARRVAAASHMPGGHAEGPESQWADVTTVAIEADVQARPGQSLYVTGNLPQLGAWAADAAVPLAFPAEGGNMWRAVLTLPAGAAAEFKLVLVEPDGQAAWQGGDNRMLKVPRVMSTVRCSWDAMDVSVEEVSAPAAPMHAAAAHAAAGSAPAAGDPVRTVLSIYMEEEDRDHSASYCLVGNAPQLGNWTVGDGPACRWLSPTELGSVFFLPQGQAAEFKVVKVDTAGNAVWQGGNNRCLDVPLCAPSAAIFCSTSWQSEAVHTEHFEGDLAYAKVEQVRLRAKLMKVSPDRAVPRGHANGSHSWAAANNEMARAY